MDASSISQVEALGLLSFGANVTGASGARESLGTAVANHRILTIRNTLALVLLVLVVLSYKNIPGVWHFRIFKALIHHAYLRPTARPPRLLFAPVITSSFNTLYETDFNIHKSSSTYFSDLDVARANFLAGLLHSGLPRLQSKDDGGSKARVYVALGGVACHFRREIAPLTSFEMHTRVLSWDDKWLYLVTHFVEKSRVKPSSYALQPWKRGSGRKTSDGSKAAGEQEKAEEQARLRKHVYATSIARYVVKRGKTVFGPETVLERSSLLPARPVSGDHKGPDAIAGETAEGISWTWDYMEAERLRGLDLARHFDGLSGLHDMQRPGEAVGEYSDWY